MHRAHTPRTMPISPIRLLRDFQVQPLATHELVISLFPSDHKTEVRACAVDSLVEMLKHAQ